MSVRTEEQEDSIEIRIARNYLNKYPNDNNSFLHLIFMAFCKADRQNFELLRPVIKILIDKYEMAAEFAADYLSRGA